ncbi:MAG: nuclear transport factor 2 family protein [Bacteroidia bacterium]
MNTIRIIGLTLTLIFASLNAQTPEASDPHAAITPVQAQLDAYNTGDLEGFLAAYHDSVKIYNFPDQLDYVGKERMRKVYGGMFERLKHLHCRLVNRIVMGNRIIDHESVIFEENGAPVEVVAMYKVEEGKIVEVRFLRKGKD